MKVDAIKFIDQIKNDALAVQAKTGIPAAVIIAQACLETAFGYRICTDIKTNRNSKNLFAIKGTGPAGSVQCWTTEYYNGKMQRVLANFRAYNSYEESFADHARLMLKPRYAPCMAVKDNPAEFAMRLQQCGYATDPKYGLKLIKIMKMFNLEGLKLPDSLPKIENISIVVLDKKFAGLLVNDVSYGPVRNMFEALGYIVTWDGNSKTVIVTKP
ncbi:MAG: glucosaminidase domain-containing protein [Firmicutes bacterium]|nr:glucosaminidase domain-containing protein [Bacillota bacterium]